MQRLWDAGVDMFNLSGWFHTNQRTDIAVARRLLPEAAIYHEMTHSTGNYPHFTPKTEYGCYGDPRPSDHQLYTTARLAHAHGADGISLFNFVYYRAGIHYDIPVMEPPFHVLPRLNDTAFLARQHQYYMVAGGTCYFRQVPRQISPGDTETFQMDMLKMDASLAGARLRVHTLGPRTDGQGLQVTFNGHPLEPTDDVSRFFGNPSDGMISPKGHRYAWDLPTDLIADGLNEIAVTSPQAVKIVYIDCGAPSRTGA